MNTSKELIEHIELRRIDENTFEGDSKFIGSPNVYGGQILAQTLNAAYQNPLEGKIAHSIHTYFFSAGDLDESTIRYKVSTNFEGKSFANKEVLAIQGDRILSKSLISFQRPEEGLSHQYNKPFIYWPRFLTFGWEDAKKIIKYLPDKIKDWVSVERPVSFKPIENPFFKIKLKATKNIWLQFKQVDEKISPEMRQQMILYAIDYNILFSAINAHRKIHHGNMQMASLDHSMWFHRNEYDISKWFLLAQDSPSTSNGRAYTRASIYASNGKLVASATQEGLFRKKRKQDKKK